MDSRAYRNASGVSIGNSQSPILIPTMDGKVQVFVLFRVRDQGWWHTAVMRDGLGRNS